MFNKIKEKNESLKEEFKRRIESNSYKTELSWTDKEGNTNTEIVYLKRSRLPLGDWHRINPPVNELTNKWNIPNLIFGGKKNLIKLLIMLAIVALFFLSYAEMVGNYNQLRSIPCVELCVKSFIHG